MKAFFHQVFDYNYFSNKQLITVCSNLEEIPSKTGQLFNHILNAHHMWNARIMDIPSEFEAWQNHGLETWEEIHYDNQRNSFEIVSNAELWERRINYVDSKGETFSCSLQDILFHIINHSTHHRAQILADLRSHDIDPPVLDYIYYKR